MAESAPSTEVRRSTRARFGLVTWAGLLLLMIAWAIASPVASGPDESGHIMKAAATVRGDMTGTPTSSQGIRSFILPANVGDMGGEVLCFAGQPNQTAICAPPLGSLSDADTTVRSGVAAYNPVYYAIVGWPSLFLDGTSMVLAIRLLNSIIVSALWASSVVVLAVGRPRATFYLLLAATPMAIYLGGVVNPSGAEIAATAATLALLDSAVRRRGQVGPLIPIMLGGAAALLVSLRSISPAFLALAVVVVLLLRGARPIVALFRRRAFIIAAITVGTFGVFAVYWTLAVSSPAGFIPSSNPARPGRAEAFMATIFGFSDQLTQMIGVMGWFDARPPEIVHAVWSALLAGALLIAALSARRRQLGVLALCAGLLLVVPAILQAVYAAEFGYIWQGRYSLPLLAIVMIVAAIAVEEGRGAPRTDPRYATAATVLLILQVVTFVFVLKRFAVGADAPWGLLLSSGAWQPPGGIWLVSTVFVAGAALTAGTTWWSVAVGSDRLESRPAQRAVAT